MGKCLIIKNADFSQNAVAKISLDEDHLYSLPSYGLIHSTDGLIASDNRYCYTAEFYTEINTINLDPNSGYVLALRLYNQDNSYYSKGSIEGMVSGTIDLTPYSQYKIRFLFTSNANYPSPTISLTDTDLQNIYDALTI